MKNIGELADEIIELRKDVDATLNKMLKSPKVLAGIERDLGNNGNEFSFPLSTGPTPPGPVIQNQPRRLLCRVINSLRRIISPSVNSVNSAPVATAGRGVPLFITGDGPTAKGYYGKVKK